MKCIYCKEEIRHPSWEEIIPYSLGGRCRNRQIVCKACNDTLGHEVDAALAGWLPFVWARNLFSLEGHKGDIPHFEVRDSQGRTYIAGPGWRLRPKDEPLDIIYEAQGTRIQIRASSETTAWQQIERIRQSLIRRYRKQGVPHPKVQLEIRSVQHGIVRDLRFEPSELSFGNDEEWRAIAKIAFEYLATKLP